MSDPFPPAHAQPVPISSLPPVPPVQKKPVALRVLQFGAVGVLGIIIGVAASGSNNSPESTPKTATSSSTSAIATPTKATHAVATSAKAVAPSASVIVLRDGRTLGDAYDENKVAADKKYKGHVVQLPATLTNVNDDRLTFGNITTKQFSLTQIACDLKNASQAEIVRSGQKYTIVGKVTGQNLGVIGMEDCVVK
jgi:tRNA_anti-like